jgi:hypothetical protein
MPTTFGVILMDVLLADRSARYDEAGAAAEQARTVDLNGRV